MINIEINRTRNKGDCGGCDGKGLNSKEANTVYVKSSKKLEEDEELRKSLESLQIAKSKELIGYKSKNCKESLDFNEENFKIDPMKRLQGALRTQRVQFYTL